MNKKISFLMAVHNEEKILPKSLTALLKIPYNNYEIIVGLDGCTDRSEEIAKEFAKKSKKIRYYKLNLRQGKPAVIDSIIKKAKGEIIFINDADWLFEAGSRKKFEDFLGVFNDSKVGGIAEAFPVEWHKDTLAKSNFGYKMEAYSTYLWIEFQKEKFSEKDKDNGSIRVVKEPSMFLTNIFRKKLYDRNFSLGDDFERTYSIMKKDYKVVLFEDENVPRIKTAYNTIKVRDIFRLKIRTAIARKQLSSRKVFKIGLTNYYIPAIFYIFKESVKKGPDWAFINSYWIILTCIATVIASFKRVSTREGWKIRLKR